MLKSAHSAQDTPFKTEELGPASIWFTIVSAVASGWTNPFPTISPSFRKRPKSSSARRSGFDARFLPATGYVVTSDDIRESGRSDPAWIRPAHRARRGRHERAHLPGRREHPRSQRIVQQPDLGPARREVRAERLSRLHRLGGHPRVLRGDRSHRDRRGAGSALYGCNAVSGVINIITKTPEQLEGGIVSVTGGERDTRWGARCRR